MKELKLALVFVGACGALACGSAATPAEPTTISPPPPSPPASTAPLIVQQPQNATIDENRETTLSVTAQGTGPLAYQWYAGARGATDSPISGGTSATLNSGPLSVTAQYWVRVTNAVGTADSDAATITVIPAPPPSPPPGPPPPPDPGAAFELEVLTIVNGHRASGAVCGSTTFGAAPALTMDSRLRDAARLHSIDMATQNYFSHTSLDGRTFSQRISAAGFNGAKPWGENIAAGYSSPASMMAGLMASPGHCSNIMNPSYRTIGVGYAFGAASSYGHYWTQNFAAGQ